MDKNIFVSDQFNTWKICKRRYYFKYIKELNWSDSEANYILGKSVHALINYHLKGFKVDNLLQDANENITAIWETIKNHHILKNNVIATEWTFNSKINGTKLWLNGRIDAIFYDECLKKYIIADWKTGQNIPKDPDNSFQSMMYLYSFYNARNDLKIDFEQEDLVFQYVKISNKVEIYNIDYSKEKEKSYNEIFTQITEEISTEKNYKETIPCPLKQCQYKKLCIK